MEYYDLKKSDAFMISVKGFVEKGSHMLVLKTKSAEDSQIIGEWNDKWHLPGGLLEFNESIQNALAREIMEEANIKVEIKNIFAIGEFKHSGFIFRDGRRLKVRVITLGFLCNYKKGEIILSEEHQAYKWVTIRSLSKLPIAPDSKDLIDQYISNCKFGAV